MKPTDMEKQRLEMRRRECSANMKASGSVVSEAPDLPLP